MRHVSRQVGEWRYIENRDGQRGAPRRELQQPGRPENGFATDQAARFPDVTKRLAAFLADWESRRPRAEPRPRGRPLTPEETEQLRSLGYLEEEAAAPGATPPR